MRPLYHFSDLPIQMIVASTEDGGIGINGKLPWPSNREDFLHFKKVTADSVVVMGSRTYKEIEEIKSQRPTQSVDLLPGRKSVVVSLNPTLITTESFFVERGLEEAVNYHFSCDRNFFVIGGLTLYTEFLPFVKTLYWTIFKQQYECDTFLPVAEIRSQFSVADVKETAELYFLRYERTTRPFK